MFMRTVILLLWLIFRKQNYSHRASLYEIQISPLFMQHMEATSVVAEIQVSYKPHVSDQVKIGSSADAFTHLLSFYPKETIYLKEFFFVMYLDRQNRVLGVYKLSEGGMTSTVTDVRIILSVALKITAKSIIISHNHPSGNPKPSQLDLTITKNIKAACELLDINLHGHILVCSEHVYCSFSDEGLM